MINKIDVMDDMFVLCGEDTTSNRYSKVINFIEKAENALKSTLNEEQTEVLLYIGELYTECEKLESDLSFLRGMQYMRHIYEITNSPNATINEYNSIKEEIAIYASTPKMVKDAMKT